MSVDLNLYLGRLFIQHNIITTEQFSVALAQYKQTQAPLVKILISQSLIMEGKLQEAQQLQLRLAEGELLLKGNLITEEQLDKAMIEGKKSEPLITTLLRLEILTKEKVDAYLKKLCALNYHKISYKNLNSVVFNLIPSKLIFRYKAFPVFKLGNYLIVAMVEPDNIITIDDIRKLTKCQICPVQIDEKKFETIRDVEISPNIEPDEIKIEVDKALSVLEDDISLKQKEEDLLQPEEQAPVGKIVNKLLLLALMSKASDIHIEPKMNELLIRFRIDGVLNPVMTLPVKLQPLLISRLKIMASLDIAEKRLPQDGRIRYIYEEKINDFRVSTMPSRYGETIVMRLLLEGAKPLSLEQLGLLKEQRLLLERAIKKPHGMILVTGPTGSGKTTTLYSVLGILNQPGVNISTVEDPIEYELENIVQSQVNHKIGLTFGAILRSILRQDPDVIMIGEIRDVETATIAIESSLTGHLVLTSFHASSTVATITRLTEMGIEPFLIASSIIGILAQRLIRRVCQSCSKNFTPSVELLNQMNISDIIGNPEKLIFKQAVGCSLCNYTGYKGRIGIFELLTINDAIRDYIIQKQSSHVIRSIAIKNGMKPLNYQAVDFLKQGVTTLEEAYPILISAEEAFSLPCPQCGQVISRDFAKCPYCQYALKEFCSECGFEVNSEWTSCPKCGHKLSMGDLFVAYTGDG